MTVTEERKHIEMIKNPGRWHGPYLPVKRRRTAGGMPDVGLILDPRCFVMDENGPMTVFETNMWSPDFANCPKHVYLTPEDVVIAGWEVD